MSQVLMATATGEQHGLINTLTNSVPFDDFKHCSPATKAKLEKEKKEDAKIVKVKYLNRIGSHERLYKPYCRYAGDPILIYNLIPNKVYELPLGFVKEVNSVKNVKRAGLMEVDGKNVNPDGSPLATDQEAEWTHMLVAANF